MITHAREGCLTGDKKTQFIIIVKYNRENEGATRIINFHWLYFILKSAKTDTFIILQVIYWLPLHCILNEKSKCPEISDFLTNGPSYTVFWHVHVLYLHVNIK